MNDRSDEPAAGPELDVRPQMLEAAGIVAKLVRFAAVVWALFVIVLILFLILWIWPRGGDARDDVMVPSVQVWLG